MLNFDTPQELWTFRRDLESLEDRGFQVSWDAEMLTIHTPDAQKAFRGVDERGYWDAVMRASRTIRQGLADWQDV